MGVNKIYLDCDGVVLRSVEGICKVVEELYNIHVSPEDIYTWNFEEFGLNLTDKEVEDLFEHPLFFKHVRFMDGVIDFINKNKDKVIIVTHATEKNYKMKRELFNSVGLQDIPIIRIPLGESKSIIDMSGGIFIDDNTVNLKESNADIKVQFREYGDAEREWNKDWDGFTLHHWQKPLDKSKLTWYNTLKEMEIER